MKALRCNTLAPDFNNLALEDIDLPEPGPGQVKLRMRAAAVGFQDTLMVQGLYQSKPPLPYTPGMEGAGEVISVGGDVTNVAPGDAVVAGLGIGAFAQEALTEARVCRPKPGGLDFAEAAAYTSAYLTAHVALHRRARLEAGETLLVHGAAGGIGLAACDLGQLMGAKVIATASTSRKRDMLKARGVDHVIDVTTPFRDEVKDLTGGKGANVIYDPVGGSVFDQSCRCIAFDGRLLIMGFTSGVHATLATNYALIKGFSVMGVRAGEYGRQFPEKGIENVKHIDALAATGKIKPFIGARFTLEKAADAIATVAARKAIGKVVVTMD